VWEILPKITGIEYSNSPLDTILVEYDLNDERKSISKS
jgi:hypothetical protein